MSPTTETDPVADLTLLPGSAPGRHPWLLFAELARQQMAFGMELQRLWWQSFTTRPADMAQPMADLEASTRKLLRTQQETAQGLMPVLERSHGPAAR